MCRSAAFLLSLRVSDFSVNFVIVSENDYTSTLFSSFALHDRDIQKNKQDFSTSSIFISVTCSAGAHLTTVSSLFYQTALAFKHLSDDVFS